MTFPAPWDTMVALDRHDGTQVPLSTAGQRRTPLAGSVPRQGDGEDSGGAGTETSTAAFPDPWRRKGAFSSAEFGWHHEAYVRSRPKRRDGSVIFFSPSLSAHLLLFPPTRGYPPGGDFLIAQKVTKDAPKRGDFDFPPRGKLPLKTTNTRGAAAPLIGCIPPGNRTLQVYQTNIPGKA